SHVIVEFFSSPSLIGCPYGGAARRRPLGMGRRMGRIRRRIWRLWRLRLQRLWRMGSSPPPRLGMGQEVDENEDKGRMTTPKYI
ncbi:hypothetical protein PFISCL1PPCAC_13935, partial [Pristionchus fissidentatus]